MNDVVSLEDFKKNLKKEAKKGKKKKKIAVLSEKQIERILQATVENRDDDPTEEEMLSVLKWAHSTTLRTAVLNGIYEDKYSVKWDKEAE